MDVDNDVESAAISFFQGMAAGDQALKESAELLVSLGDDTSALLRTFGQLCDVLGAQTAARCRRCSANLYTTPKCEGGPVHSIPANDLPTAVAALRALCATDGDLPGAVNYHFTNVASSSSSTSATTASSSSSSSSSSSVPGPPEPTPAPSQPAPATQLIRLPRSSSTTSASSSSSSSSFSSSTQPRINSFFPQSADSVVRPSAGSTSSLPPEPTTPLNGGSSFDGNSPSTVSIRDLEDDYSDQDREPSFGDEERNVELADGVYGFTEVPGQVDVGCAVKIIQGSHIGEYGLVYSCLPMQSNLSFQLILVGASGSKSVRTSKPPEALQPVSYQEAGVTMLELLSSAEIGMVYPRSHSDGNYTFARRQGGRLVPAVGCASGILCYIDVIGVVDLDVAVFRSVPLHMITQISLGEGGPIQNQENVGFPTRPVRPRGMKYSDAIPKWSPSSTAVPILNIKTSQRSEASVSPTPTSPPPPSKVSKASTPKAGKASTPKASKNSPTSFIDDDNDSDEDDTPPRKKLKRQGSKPTLTKRQQKLLEKKKDEEAAAAAAEEKKKKEAPPPPPATANREGGAAETEKKKEEWKHLATILGFTPLRDAVGKSGVELLTYGLTQAPGEYRRLAALAGLMALGAVNIKMVLLSSQSEANKILSFPTDRLERLTICEMESLYHIPNPSRSPYGVMTDTSITRAMLNYHPPLARERMNFQTGNPYFTAEYHHQKAELIRFLHQNQPYTAPSLPTTPSGAVPAIQIYGSRLLFTPSRFHGTPNAGARHLMSLVTGPAFHELSNPEITARPLDGPHRWTPTLNCGNICQIMKLRGSDIRHIPCQYCALPQIVHRECTQETPIVASISTCMLCKKPRDQHTIRVYVKGQRRPGSLSHPLKHGFVAPPSDYAECSNCRTPHRDLNGRIRGREDLVLWDPPRVAFQRTGAPKSHTVAFSLAIPKIPSSYVSSNDISLMNCTLRPYQAHAVDWMVNKEKNVDQALIRYRPVCYVNPSDGVYYYSDVMGDYSETPRTIHGGLLCSEMGMGKTVMILGLCVASGVRTPGDDGYRVKRGKKRTLECNPPSMHKLGDMPLGGTLIITKATLWSQWSREVRSKIKPEAGYIIMDYHSGIALDRRVKMPLHEADFVVTNIDMLTSGKVADDGSLCPIANIWWHRIIVDECHFLNHTTTSQTKCVMALRATNRWILSGTPLPRNSNSLEGLMTALYGVAVLPDHIARMEHKISRWIERHALRHSIKSTYTDGTLMLALPPKSSRQVRVVFTEGERKVYNRSVEGLRDSLASRTNSHNWYAYWSAAATKLRQLCSHFHNVSDPFSLFINEGVLTYAWGSRAVSPPTSGALPHDRIQQILKPLVTGSLLSQVMATLAKPQAEYECPICFEMAEAHIAVTKCGHTFCSACIIPLAANKAPCPVCRTQLTEDFILVAEGPKKVIEVAEDKVEGAQLNLTGDKVMEAPSASATPEAWFNYLREQASSKISHMVDLIRGIRREDPEAKFVIFTQFECTIRVVERSLQRTGIKAERITGGMTQMQRRKAQESFANDPMSVVFLLTVRSGSCGLNLVSANHVILLEPCINKALEEQAIGRCYRMGQVRAVTVHRFFVADTFEEVLEEASTNSSLRTQGTSLMTPAMIGKLFDLPLPNHRM